MLCSGTCMALQPTLLAMLLAWSPAAPILWYLAPSSLSCPNFSLLSCLFFPPASLPSRRSLGGLCPPRCKVGGPGGARQGAARSANSKTPCSPPSSVPACLVCLSVLSKSCYSSWCEWRRRPQAVVAASTSEDGKTVLPCLNLVYSRSLQLPTNWSSCDQERPLDHSFWEAPSCSLNSLLLLLASPSSPSES